jgi:hypothetical protein
MCPRIESVLISPAIPSDLCKLSPSEAKKSGHESKSVHDNQYKNPYIHPSRKPNLPQQMKEGHGYVL